MFVLSKFFTGYDLGFKVGCFSYMKGTNHQLNYLLKLPESQYKVMHSCFCVTLIVFSLFYNRLSAPKCTEKCLNYQETNASDGSALESCTFSYPFLHETFYFFFAESCGPLPNSECYNCTNRTGEMTEFNTTAENGLSLFFNNLFKTKQTINTKNFNIDRSLYISG